MFLLMMTVEVNVSKIAKSAQRELRGESRDPAPSV